MKLYQRGEDGYPIGSDALMREAYGRIPDAKRFQTPRDGWQEPVTLHGWNWSDTFHRWGALVTFADGWHGWTWPEHR